MLLLCSIVKHYFGGGMIFKLLWLCGSCTVGIAAAAYLLTWLTMALWPSRVLLGGVEALWLRFLLRTAYVGVTIILLGAFDALAADLLAGRH
jgi:hypothetical protein